MHDIVNLRLLWLTFITLSAMQCQRDLQISRVNNIGSVRELSGVALHLNPYKGGILVQILHSHSGWWMTFLFNFIEAVCVIRQLWG